MRAGLCLLAWVGCASMGVHTETAPQANIANYHTYSWVPPAGGNNREPLSILDQKVRAALSAKLAQRGLVEVQDGAPNFLVDYHILQEHKVAVTDWGNGIYGWAPEVKQFYDGTLIVDFVDPQTHRIFWRGSVTNAVEPPGNVDARRLEKAVARVIDRYPRALVSGTAKAAAP